MNHRSMKPLTARNNAEHQLPFSLRAASAEFPSVAAATSAVGDVSPIRDMSPTADIFKRIVGLEQTPIVERVRKNRAMRRAFRVRR